MRALLIPHTGPFAKLIDLEVVDGLTLRALQAQVGGSVECVQLTLGDLWLNEDGNYVCFTEVVGDDGVTRRIPQTNELATYLVRQTGALTAGVLGNAVITGPVGRRGETTEVTVKTVRLINRVVGVTFGDDGELLPDDWNGES